MAGIMLISIVVCYILVASFLSGNPGILGFIIMIVAAILGGWAIGAGIAEFLFPGSWKIGGIVGLIVEFGLFKFVNSNNEN